MPTTEKSSGRRGWIADADGDVGPLRIALAEDDCQMRAMLGGVLRRDGHEVFEARDGRELVTVLGTVDDIDLVVTDLRMPVLDGLGALRQLRKSGMDVPVLIMTAFPDQHVYAEAGRHGAVGVLDKPFEITDFRTLALVVGRRQRSSGG